MGWDWDTAESEGVKGSHTGKDGFGPLGGRQRSSLTSSGFARVGQLLGCWLVLGWGGEVRYPRGYKAMRALALLLLATHQNLMATHCC